MCASACCARARVQGADQVLADHACKPGALQTLLVRGQLHLALLSVSICRLAPRLPARLTAPTTGRCALNLRLNLAIGRRALWRSDAILGRFILRTALLAVCGLRR